MIAALLVLGVLPGSAHAEWLPPSDAPLDAVPAMAAGAPALAYDGKSLVAAWPEAGSKANPGGLRSARLGPDTHNTWQPLPSSRTASTFATCGRGSPTGAWCSWNATQAGASAPSRVVVARQGESGGSDQAGRDDRPSQRSASQPSRPSWPACAVCGPDRRRWPGSIGARGGGDGRGGWTSVGAPLSTGADPESPALAASAGTLTAAWIETAPGGARVVRAARLYISGSMWISSDVPPRSPGLTPVDAALHDGAGKPWIGVGEAARRRATRMAEFFVPGSDDEFLRVPADSYSGVMPGRLCRSPSTPGAIVGVSLVDGGWKTFGFRGGGPVGAGPAHDARGTSLVLVDGRPWAAWLDHPNARRTPTCEPERWRRPSTARAG